MTLAFEPVWKQSTVVSQNSIDSMMEQQRKDGLTDVFNGREVVCQILPGVHFG